MCVEYRKSYEICFMILKKENTCSFPSHTMMEAYFRIQPAVLCGSVLDCRVAVHFPVGEWTSPNVSSTNTDKLSLVSFVISVSGLAYYTSGPFSAKPVVGCFLTLILFLFVIAAECLLCAQNLDTSR